MRHSVLIILFAVFLPSVSWAQKQPFPLKGGLKVVPGVLGKNIVIGRAPVPNAIKAPRFNFTKQLKDEHIELKSGDIFRGSFERLDPDSGVVWNHPHVSPQLKITPAHIKHIQFGDNEALEKTKIHSSKITLINGDGLSGDLIGLKNRMLTVNTWHGGEIQIKQSAIKSLIPGFTTLKTLYEGPKNIRNWVFYDASSGKLIKELESDSNASQIEAKTRQVNAAQGTWRFNNMSLEAKYSQARVGRQFKEIPTLARFDFDVEWSSYMNLYVNFLSDRLDSYSTGNSYCLRLNTSYAYLYRYTRRNGVGGGRNIGSNVRINLNELGNRARISIRIDRSKNIIALYINEKFLKKWEDAQQDEIPDEAKGLLFTSMSSNSVAINNISMSEWNGTLPNGNKTTTGNGVEDFVFFINEDSISGNLLGIQGGNITFKTSFAELPIPLKNISQINLARPTESMSIPKGSVRAVLRGNKGSLTGTISDWNNGKITLTSPLFNKASFDENAFERIEFKY